MLWCGGAGLSGMKVRSDFILSIRCGNGQQISPSPSRSLRLGRNDRGSLFRLRVTRFPLKVTTVRSPAEFHADDVLFGRRACVPHRGIDAGSKMHRSFAAKATAQDDNVSA